MPNTFVKYLLTCWACLAVFVAIGQKLPSVQEISVFAPNNIRIDGKPTEWETSFQAHNTSTDIFYILSNDTKNLYLCVQARDPTTINRMFAGGVTFIIQQYIKKQDENNISITYPAVKNKQSLFFPLRQRKGTVADTSQNAADSLMIRSNNTLMQKCNWLVTSGISGIDTLSIYNDVDIRANGLFDNNKIYTYELAIPLKYLKKQMLEGAKFAYHLKINGTVNIPKASAAVTDKPEATARAQQTADRLNQIMAAQNAPTDFWGEYTLAKKP